MSLSRKRHLPPSPLSVSLSLHSNDLAQLANSDSRSSTSDPATSLFGNHWNFIQSHLDAPAVSWDDTRLNGTIATFASTLPVSAAAPASGPVGCSKSSLYGGLEDAVYLYAVPLVCGLGVALNVLSLVVLAGCACPLGSCCCGPACEALELRRRRHARLFRAPTYWLMRAIALADALSLALSAPIGYVR